MFSNEPLSLTKPSKGWLVENDIYHPVRPIQDVMQELLRRHCTCAFWVVFFFVFLKDNSRLRNNSCVEPCGIWTLWVHSAQKKAAWLPFKSLGQPHRQIIVRVSRWNSTNDPWLCAWWLFGSLYRKKYLHFKWLQLNMLFSLKKNLNRTP